MTRPHTVPRRRPQRLTNRRSFLLPSSAALRVFAFMLLAWAVFALTLSLAAPSKLKAGAGRAPAPAAHDCDDVVAVVRHSPSVNGRIEGSVWMLDGENVSINNSSTITSDLLVPGTPYVQVNGSPDYQGTLDGAGSAQPADYVVTINNGAQLRHVVRRTDPVTLDDVPVPPAPAGTRDVTFDNPGDDVGDWETVRNLTLGPGVESVVVPPGTYNHFVANRHAYFVFGVAGVTTPSVYNLDTLTLNSYSGLRVLGPVIVNVADHVTVNSNAVAGDAQNLSWLELNVARGGVTVNHLAVIYGVARAPAGTVHVNGRLRGSVMSDGLALGSDGRLEVMGCPAPVNQPPNVNAGADRTVTLPSVPRDRSFELRPFAVELNDPVGIDYHQPTNGLLMSLNYPSGEPYNFALVGAGGGVSALSNVGGLGGEVKPAVARDDTGYGMSLGGFHAGEVFAGTDAPGVLLRISPGGSSVQNPWVTLPGETGMLRGSPHVDRTGVFGGDLVVVTNAGGVWRVNSAGTPTLVARLNAYLEGLTTVPTDAARYGPWAGKVLAGDATQGRVYAIDAEGHAASYPLGIRPTDIDLIPAGENFFGIDPGSHTLYGAEAAGFAKMAGDVLIAQESPGLLFRVHWNGTEFEKTQLAAVTQWGQVAFAPAGLPGLPTVAAVVTLDGTATDDGLPEGFGLSTRWSRVSGPGPVSFSAATPATSAAFIVPGTYVLRLTADDGELTAGDEVTVTVNPPNLGPVVDAGPDQTVMLPSGARLNGVAGDDGLPAGHSLTTLWTQVSGPGPGTFADPAAQATDAAFIVPGTYVLRLTADDGDLTSFDELSLTVKPENHAPVVDAGPDQTVTLPSTATLNGTAGDDGVPIGSPLQVAWSVASGPGTVTFSSPNSPTTNATFSTDGTYVLRLTASDGELSVSDDVTVTVRPRVNLAPSVDAGPDRVVVLPAHSATLNGSVADDGLPAGGTLTMTWSKLSGPTPGSFTSPNSPVTTVGFGQQQGTWVFKLTASDGQLQASDTVTVTTVFYNYPPTVNAGPDQLITLSTPASLSGTATDDGQPAGSALATLWTQVSGPGTVTFADPRARATNATFSAEGTYVLRLTASDSQFTVSDELTVVVQPPLPAGHLTCTRSNKGTDFWLMFDENYSTPQSLSLFITGDQSTTGTVSIPGMQFQSNFSVTPGQVTTVSLPVGAAVNVSDGTQAKGVHVVAQREVAVYGLNRLQYTSDGFLALPTTVLGTEYVVLGYSNNNVNGTQFGVVATADNTTVTITPSVAAFRPVAPGFTISRPAGVPYNITLNQGQAYQLRSTVTAPADLSGSIISSNNPVAVFGGHQCANIPSGYAACDHIVEQLTPPDTWGKNFVTMSLATRRNGDTFRVLAAQDNTKVAVNGEVVATLNRGKVYERVTNGPSTITSDKPVLVAQYANSSSFDNVIADPFMMLVTPYEQFGGSYTLATPDSGFLINFVNVVAPTQAVGQVKLDGVNVSPSKFVTIGVSGFAGAQVNVTKGTHNLSAPFPFGASIYGFADYDSYGYSGGTCLATASVGTRVALAPKVKTNLVGTQGCVTAAVTDLSSKPLGGIRVEFAVTGVNPTTGAAQTDAGGLAQFCYVGANAGADLVVASVGANVTDSASKQWNPPNRPPVVDAGPDRTVTLPAPVTLGGTVTDDGLPAGQPSITWSKTSGPGLVNFADAHAPTTNATFNAPGTYVLRLTADDTEFNAGDEVTVTVNPVPPNQPPTVNAGADQTVALGANLLVNPGGEQPPEAGEIPGWFEAAGEVWTRGSAGSGGLPESFEGGAYFYAGETEAAELRQDVSLRAFAGTVAAGTQRFTFKASLRSRAESPADTAKVVIEYRDDANNVVLGTLESGETASTDGWVRLEDTRAAPVGTGWIRVRLIATRRTSTTNDAYFDALELRPVGTAGVVLSGTATDDGLPYGSTLHVNWTKVSGPGTVSFADATAAATSATFDTPGTYVLRLTADDTEATAADDVTVIVLAPNQSPVVNAGPDQTVTLPDAVTLGGTVTDDGLPLGATLGSRWSKLNGPGVVTFADEHAPATTAAFSAPGVYTLRLTADDTEFSAADGLIVTVKPQPVNPDPAVNHAPAVGAGPDQTVVLPSNSVTLRGTATDDRLPAGSQLSLDWTQVSGPGAVSFADAHAAITVATFSAEGVYVLRLTAGDSELSAADDVRVSVIQNVAPPRAVINSPADGARVTTATPVVGTVSDASSWRVEYSLGGDEGSGGPPAWVTLASGNAPVAGGPLATFDPTLLLNGIYAVRLVATNAAGQTAIDSVNVNVDGEQKVGNFTVTFSDLNVPVAGLPIEVLRTYDSRDKRVGDFGYGWTLGLRNVRLEKSGVLGEAWDEVTSGGFLPSFCAQPAKPHTITITFPAGKSFRFEAAVAPQCQSLYPLQLSAMAFTPARGTHASLRVVGPADIFLAGDYPGPVELLDLDTLDLFDPTLFKLTLEDGTSYIIDQRDGVHSVTDPNGNTLTITRNGITHSSGKSVSFTRDAQGRITCITDPNGNALVYSYDANGDLVGFQDREGNATSFTYNSTHGLLTINDPRGVPRVRNDYDAQGRLIRQTDALGHAVNYTHDLNARHEVVTDRLGRATVFEYDAEGNILRVTDPEGGVTTRTYDADANVLSETDPLGHTTVYTYDARGDRTSETGPLGHTTRYTYNGLHRLLTVTDPQGHVTAYTYDDRGNKTSVRDALGATTAYAYDARGLLTSSTDAHGNKTSYQYDAAGNLAARTDPYGRATAYTYDADGNLLSESVTRTVAGAPERLTTSYQYDRAGRRTKTTFPDGSAAETVYDAAGQVSATVDKMERRTAFEYDDLGQLVRTTSPDGSQVSSAYDAEGRRTQSVDRAGRVTAYAYDALGRLQKTTYPDGTFTAATYDAAGQGVSASDPLGNVTRYEYDAAGRQTRGIDALGHATAFAYDAAGNRVSVTDARGQQTRFEYDPAGRDVRTVFPDQTSESFAYDARGQVTARTDQAGRATRFEYDKLGRVSKITDARGGVTAYTYDEAGHRLTQTDANGHTTSYQYDRMGRRVRRTLPLSMSETYSYDFAGRMVGRTDFRGKRTAYAYDALGRLLSRTPDPTLNEPAVTFTYTAEGRRASMTDASGVTTYAYDALGRLASRQMPQGTLAYSYDAAGNVLTVRSPDDEGVSVDYTYDALGRLAAVNDNRLAAGATAYAYDANGNLESTARPNGVTTVYTYDSLGRLTGVVSSKGGATLASYVHTLGAAGQRLSVAEHGGRTVGYAYDPLYRLTEERVGGDAQANGVVNYTYDAVGNRLSRESTLPGVGTYFSAYDANDRLKSATYDSNGNAIGARGASYAYDSENRLVAAGGSAVRYVYDGDGHRVAAVADAGTPQQKTTYYLWDDSLPNPQVVAEWEQAAGGPRVLTARYSYGAGGEPLATHVRQADGTFKAFYFVADGQGSARCLTDEQGNVTDSYAYDAWGNALPGGTGGTPNPLRYNGQRLDPTGLYHLRARQYDPAAGRFLSHDPVSGDATAPLTLHRYTYAGNNPVNFADPSGREYTLIGFTNTLGIQNSLQNTKNEVDQQVLQDVSDQFGGPDFSSQAIGLQIFQDVTGVDLEEVAAQGLAALAEQLELLMPELGGFDTPPLMMESNMRGGPAVQALDQAISAILWMKGWEVEVGFDKYGNRLAQKAMKPLVLPAKLKRGRVPGSVFPDIVATKVINGKLRRIRIQTVDTDAMGRLTAGELKAANAILQRSAPGEKLILIPKRRRW